MPHKKTNNQSLIKLLFIFICLIFTTYGAFKFTKLQISFNQENNLTQNGNNASWMPEIIKESSQHYLPDYTYAGYKNGESPLPIHEVTHNILDFSAIPNDSIDDNKAIQSAIEFIGQQTTTSVIYFPKGEYIVSGIISIQQSNIVLRGDRINKTLFTLFNISTIKGINFAK